MQAPEWRRYRQRIAGLLAGFLLSLPFHASVADTDTDTDTVRIGWSGWPDAEFVTRLAERVLVDEMGQSVELVQTDIAPQYQGLVLGDIDVMLMAWLPDTHADYLERVGGSVTDLGVLYDHARLGWAVPEYVPADQLATIDDLADEQVRERLGGVITGIDPGAGLTRLSQQALEAYGLDGYELDISSDQGMTEALGKAVAAEDWIVVTGWSPHWMFAAWDLRYLEDPEGILGGIERIHALAGGDFYRDNPAAATMLARMWIPLDALQEAMHEARETSPEAAVDAFIEAYPERIRYWVTGAID